MFSGIALPIVEDRVAALTSLPVKNEGAVWENEFKDKSWEKCCRHQFPNENRLFVFEVGGR